MQKFAIFGGSVAHSRSPQIHAAFARQTGIELDYARIDATPQTFAQTLREFVADGGLGGNVTIPLKETAFALCTTTSGRAQCAGAVNTLAWRDGAWFGDNTDGTGLVRDLTERHGLDLRDRRMLLLGAGGAARGVAPALLDAGVAEMFVVNRTPERADALCDALGEPARAHSRYWEQLGELGEFDLIVNTTAAGRSAEYAETGHAMDLPFSLATARTAAVDINYGEVAVAFLSWAKAANVRDTIDGVGMLVEQAAESFALWHGVRPDTDAVHAQLRKEI